VTSGPRSAEDAVRFRRGWRERFDWDARRGGAAGIIVVLTATQWLNWSSTYYLMTVLARPIAAETGWSLVFVVTGLSLGLVTAGLASPRVGRAIERHGGRPMLALGSLLLAVGLLGVGLSRDPIGYLAAWIVIGIAMAASLSDAAFATLGRFYGLRAKTIISNLMVLIAFSATFSWPFTALLTEALGWRGTCLCYAAMHLAIGLPMHLLLLPKTATLPVELSPLTPARAEAASLKAVQGAGRDRRTLLIWLVGTNITLQIAIGSVLAVHLLSLLQALGVAYAAAVGFGSVIWLSQGGGRVIDALFGRRFHPVLEGVVASLLVLLGIALLLAAPPSALLVGIVLFGIGNGVRGILKGTLPLVLFGAEGYATLIGRLGLPTLIAQAAGPALGAVALAQWGAMPLLAILAALAALNLGLASALWMATPRLAR
jgi:MFS family permease